MVLKMKNTSTIQLILPTIFKQLSLHSETSPRNCRLQSQHSFEFVEDFHRNRIPLTTIQKAILGIGSSIVGLYNPRRLSQITHHKFLKDSLLHYFSVDMLACSAEIFGVATLRKILADMRASSIGSQILDRKPDIFKGDGLRCIAGLRKDTFGWAFMKFLCDHDVSSDTKMPVRYIDDPELAYIMVRCRQIHDYLHVLLNVPTNKVGEITLKWVEATNIGLPTAYVAAISGCAYIPRKDREKFVSEYLPLAIRNGKNNIKFYLIYWEKLFTQNLNNLRQVFNIETFGE